MSRSPFTALPLDPLPPSAVVPIALSLPCVLPLPPWPYLSRSTSLSFPLGGGGANDLPRSLAWGAGGGGGL